MNWKTGVGLLPKWANETAVLLLLPKDAVAKFAAFALSRDEDPRIIMAAALRALAEETAVPANLVDEDL